MASSPEVLSVLAHDLRWTIVGLLVPGDLRTSELVSRTGQPPSLVSYHLARLRDAGLITARRSAADGRDSYHVLDLDALGQAMASTADQIHPSLIPGLRGDAAGPVLRGDLAGPMLRGDLADPGLQRDLADPGLQGDGTGPGAREDVACPRADPPGSRALVQVLFVCSGNSSRSPMAAGWLNHLGAGQVTARSAGTAPRPLHPLSVAAMAEHGIDISGHEPTHLDDYAGDGFTRVITLCDRAREDCGELPGAAPHWSIPNPAQAHPPDLDAFRATARELRNRIRYLLPTLVESSGS